MKVILQSFANYVSQHSTLFCPELSPTPMQLFPLDFFVHKVQTNLDRGKILVFEKKFFFLSKFAPTSQHGLKLPHFETSCVPKMPLKFPKKVENQKSKIFPRSSFISPLHTKKSRGKTLLGVGESSGQKMFSPDQSDSNASKVEK